MSELERHELWDVYNSWHESNRENILHEKWSLTSEDILNNPGRDTERGVNLLSFMDKGTNRKIDELLNNNLHGVIGDCGWDVPWRGRHLTILDMLPHNSGYSVPELRGKADLYSGVVDRVVNSRNWEIEITFSGVFASLDGVTLQGFPQGDSLAELRNELREELSREGLMNLETKKYFINSAHVALIKFTEVLNGEALLEAIDRLREIFITDYLIDNLVLNISSRYDKVKTIEVIETWNI